MYFSSVKSSYPSIPEWVDLTRLLQDNEVDSVYSERGSRAVDLIVSFVVISSDREGLEREKVRLEIERMINPPLHIDNPEEKNTRIVLDVCKEWGKGMPARLKHILPLEDARLIGFRCYERGLNVRPEDIKKLWDKLIREKNKTK